MGCDLFQIVLRYPEDPESPLDGMVFPAWCQAHMQPFEDCLLLVAEL